MQKNNWDEYTKNFKKLAIEEGKDDNYIINNLAYAENLFKRRLPIIFDGKHLGLITGIEQAYLYKVANSQQHFYRHFYIKKRNGNKRKIQEPLPNLKKVQKWILDNILYSIDISPFAKGYVKGLSVKDNVRFHRKQKIVLKLDIVDFFTSIKTEEIYLIFKNIGYNNKVSLLLASLCTVDGCLPQGGSTSACLSNIFLKQFDRKIGNYCIKQKIRYTRYADDLSFSGDFEVVKLINFVKKCLELIGLNINKDKIKVLKSSQSQNITGIVVNEKIQVSKTYRRRIRLEVYYIKKNGLSKHLINSGNNLNFELYLKQLLGKINYCIFINPKDISMLEYAKYIDNLSQTYKRQVVKEKEL